MVNDNEQKEMRIKRLAEVFYVNKWRSHIKTYNSFFNGLIFDIFDTYLEIHDRVKGRTKIPYIDIIKIVEFTPDTREDKK